MSVFTRKTPVEALSAEPSALAHRPKVEHFNVSEHTNTDPKGFVRPVETYLVKSFGLYMARRSDHPKFHYLESWLLPEFDLRISIFHREQHFHRDAEYYKGKPYYIDIGQYVRGERDWLATDLYLDIVVHQGKDAILEDVDELLAAVSAGYIDTETAQRALERAVSVMTGLAQHGYDHNAWLKSIGLELAWR